MDENKDPNYSPAKVSPKSKSSKRKGMGEGKGSIKKTKKDNTEKEKKIIERHSKSMHTRIDRWQKRLESVSYGALRACEERLSEIKAKRILKGQWKEAMLEIAGICSQTDSEDFMGVCNGGRAYDFARLLGAFWVTVSKNYQIPQHVQDIAVGFGDSINQYGDEMTNFPKALMGHTITEDEWIEGEEEDFDLENEVRRYNGKYMIHEYEPKRRDYNYIFVGLVHKLKPGEEVPDWFSKPSKCRYQNATTCARIPSQLVK
mmetsp:Transcript_20385/g.29490  ORF Transcript_20385/g.29490 Transcript_20385/m.29490 type:complete len:259 (-) Transcript_20385:471-1247(-)|eukprot:CAMPEP_0113936568 /NCGR_PEP_ID=MMETSP1339-20121228/3456_1 /TAXON_ID=94617 /ORGANISM="Fibrocapsa japonica" /LENGTH=258 /DNA_ID=CAMNT_0000939089 /DNA_START=11 /DNA_END=787 /DNA_ORIENTATION=- /assembly_acc=CAM_ASM_000762